MRKVKLDSSWVELLTKISQSIRAKGKFYILWPLVFCLNSSILLCGLQLQAPWHRVCRGHREKQCISNSTNKNFRGENDI